MTIAFECEEGDNIRVGGKTYNVLVLPFGGHKLVPVVEIESKSHTLPVGTIVKSAKTVFRGAPAVAIKREDGWVYASTSHSVYADLSWVDSGEYVELVAAPERDEIITDSLGCEWALQPNGKYTMRVWNGQPRLSRLKQFTDRTAEWVMGQ